MVRRVERLRLNRTVRVDEAGILDSKMSVGEGDVLIVGVWGTVAEKLVTVHLCRVVRMRRKGEVEDRHREEKSDLSTRNKIDPPSLAKITHTAKRNWRQSRSIRREGSIQRQRRLLARRGFIVRG